MILDFNVIPDLKLSFSRRELRKAFIHTKSFCSQIPHPIPFRFSVMLENNQSLYKICHQNGIYMIPVTPIKKTLNGG
jgi:hypothetical protein